MTADLDTQKISYQEVLNRDPSPRLIVGRQGQILFGNQACYSLLPGVNSDDPNLSIADFAPLFGGEEELGSLIQESSPGKAATAIISFPTKQGLNLLRWSVVREDQILYLYGQEMNMADPVTGLFNRAYLEAEINRIDTLRELPVSILFVDANELKRINDLNDHSVGDTYLFLIAQLLVHSLRSNDILGRWGGDEDLVLLPKTDPDTAQILINRIHSNKDELNNFLDGSLSYSDLSPQIQALVDKSRNLPGFNRIKNVSFTIGVHTKDFGSKQSLRELVDQADRDMLEHKKKFLSDAEITDRLNFAISS